MLSPRVDKLTVDCVPHDPVAVLLAGGGPGVKGGTKLDQVAEEN